jgi:DNA-directed RNA polymerase subunit RPC12/RpoP
VAVVERCPECGAELDSIEGRLLEACPECGTSLVVKQEDEGPIQDTVQDVMPAPQMAGGAWAPPYPGPGPAAFPSASETFHPGVYDRPPEAARLDLVNLFRLLFKPREAFEAMHSHTNAWVGIAMAIVIVAVTTVYTLNVTEAAVELFDLPDEAQVGVVNRFDELGTAAYLALFAIEMAMFVVATTLVYLMLKHLGGARRADLGKTFGLVGYAKLPAFLLNFVLMPFTILSASIDTGAMGDALEGGGPTPEWVGTACGIYLLWLVLLLVNLVWALWVHSHAAAVANDSRPRTAFGVTLMAWLVAFGVQFAAQFMLFGGGTGLF